MFDRSTLLRNARSAALIAAIITAGCVLGNVLHGLRERHGPVPEHTWWVIAGLSGLLFALVFAMFFAYNLFIAARAQPELDILNEETPEPELLRQPMSGFVAMEFYWGISNRTFLVMAAPDGLYGWKVQGPVTNANRRYFETYQEMLGDAGFSRDLPAIRKLAALRGGFVYPKSGIVSITSDARRQWGMGGIGYSGHVHLRLTSGKTRKLIVLGEVDPDDVRERIVATLGIGITSVM